MRSQVVFIGGLCISAIIAIPLFYDQRMNVVAWALGVVLFVAVPFIVGISQKRPNDSLTLVAAILLLLCPIVYAVTDGLDVQFEKLRDGHFLATGATLTFVCAAWLIYSVRERKWGALTVAILGLVAATAAVYILLWIVLYFE